jgi:hypothetical protein
MRTTTHFWERNTGKLARCCTARRYGAAGALASARGIPRAVCPVSGPPSAAPSRKQEGARRCWRRAAHHRAPGSTRTAPVPVSLTAKGVAGLVGSGCDAACSCPSSRFQSLAAVRLRLLSALCSLRSVEPPGLCIFEKCFAFLTWYQRRRSQCVNRTKKSTALWSQGPCASPAAPLSAEAIAACVHQLASVTSRLHLAAVLHDVSLNWLPSPAWIVWCCDCCR